MPSILTADIGGTNSRFASFDLSEDGSLSLVEMKWLGTQDASSFSGLLENLKASGFQLDPADSDIAVIAVAGPVEKGKQSSPPFISWDIDISGIDRTHGIRSCVLINDFVAQAYACRSPVGEKADRILEGDIVSNATAAVIGAGTGLGKAALVPDDRGGFIAVPSEGGHTNFPFESERELEFRHFMLRRFGDRYMTGNRVVSGSGLAALHEFLTGESVDPKEFAAKLSGSPETLEWSARFYGRVCRNYALETLALGGTYIAGGVAARSPEIVTHTAFRDEFRTSDTMAHILEKIPVFLIRDQNSGLWGAAALGLQNLRRKRGSAPGEMQ